MKSIECGDWHLSWGLSGNDKIGRLTKLDDFKYEWKGYSQGRHGSKWNKGAKAIIETDSMNYISNIEIIKGSIPRRTEIQKQIIKLCK